MTRDEVLRFGLEAAKDEYARGQARLALVETKAGLIAVTVGAVLALVAALCGEHVPHGNAATVLLLMMSIGGLLTSLVLSLAASVLVDVKAPRRARTVCEDCRTLLGEAGEIATDVVDAVAAERLVGETCARYLVASQAVAELLAERTWRLQAAQVLLIVGLVFLTVLIGLGYLPDILAHLSGKE